MATDLKEVLGKYVPAAVLDEAVEEVSQTDIAPDWYRKQAAEMGGAAKERDDLRSRLESIESAPRRKEALKRVGIDYDAVPKYGQKALDGLPADDLDNLEKVAQFVQEQGFEANLTNEQTPPQSGAERITAATIEMGNGTPTTETYEEAVAKADSEKDLDAVYARFGKPVPERQG